MIIEDDDDWREPLAQDAVTEQHLISDIERLRVEKDLLTRRLQHQQKTKQDIEVWSKLCGLCDHYTNGVLLVSI